MQLLGSAARTATTNVNDLASIGPGVIFDLRVTAASGTGGLVFRIMLEDASGNPLQVNSDPAAILTTGSFMFIIYPSTLSGALISNTRVKQITLAPISNPFGLQVAHLDASSYTYSIDAMFVL